MTRSRQAEATRRNCKFICGVVRLPKVPMSKGVFSVSAMTSWIEPRGARNSSATACVSEVRIFCPTSAFPVNTVTAPFSLRCSQAPISAGMLSSNPRCLRPDSCADSARGTINTTATPPPKTFRNSRRPSSKW